MSQFALFPFPTLRSRPSLHRALILLLGLAATGCTTWTKPGATEHERQATLTRCEAASLLQAPPEMYRAMLSAARHTPPSTFCQTDSKGRKTCSESGGEYRPAVYADRDANDAPRRAVFRDCMFSFGWLPE